MKTVSRKAKAHADSKGYKSDKEQYTTTPWTEWCIRLNSFTAGYKAALRELKKKENK